jgi:hypothetical protein
MASRHLACAFVAACLAIAVPGRSQAVDGLRCGGRLAQGGDTRDAVRKKCGDPSDVTRQTIRRRPSYFHYGVLYYIGDEVIEIPVEIWTYNFGPNKFMRRLRFVDGLLEQVETLGYGYHERN